MCRLLKKLTDDFKLGLLLELDYWTFVVIVIVVVVIIAVVVGLFDQENETFGTDLYNNT
jgi:hypothetical protein